MGHAKPNFQWMYEQLESVLALAPSSRCWSDALVVSLVDSLNRATVVGPRGSTYVCSRSSRAFVVLLARGVFVSVEETSFFTGEGLMRL